MDTTVNYSAHVKFVSKWLDKLEAEEKKAAEPATSEPAPAEDAAPAPAPDAAAAAAEPTAQA